eukprot:TRINITY_DN1941_c0_g1_i3.p2 TRINITY_DN1941_c0_g1~~TRINITY_DN1941_c0_g1_i3.p2  ORF type:complete len:107 (+),score=18.79 TRINITY_DN1941_c0_g1_i3:952-1272(+)
MATKRNNSQTVNPLINSLLMAKRILVSPDPKNDSSDLKGPPSKPEDYWAEYDLNCLLTDFLLKSSVAPMRKSPRAVSSPFPTTSYEKESTQLHSGSPIESFHRFLN